MTWILKEKEIKSVIVLQAAKRYSYFVKKIADEEKVWSLWNEKFHWMLTSDSIGDDKIKEIFPLWPHAEYAKLCATGLWDSYQPREISINDFIKKWIPGLEKEQKLIAVFPVPIPIDAKSTGNRGIIVEPMRLESDLLEELSKYEYFKEL